MFFYDHRAVIVCIVTHTVWKMKWRRTEKFDYKLIDVDYVTYKEHLFQTLYHAMLSQTYCIWYLQCLKSWITLQHFFSFSIVSHSIPFLQEEFLGWYCIIFQLESYIITTVPTVIVYVEILLLCVFPHLRLEHIIVAYPFPRRTTLWSFTERDGTVTFMEVS